MSVSTTGVGQSLGGYGEIAGVGVGGGEYAAAPGENWGKIIAEAIATNNEVTQSNGSSLNACNQESTRLIRRTRQINEARAEVGNFINLFPVQMGKEDNNPMLKDIQGILKDRESGAKKDEIEKPYDDKKLEVTSGMLAELGMTGLTGDSRKSEFETIRTKLDGYRDEVSSSQSMVASKQGLIIGNINQLQTGIQGLIKAAQSIAMGFARITGSV
ncbi:hypothetical protein [Bordetella genomosp. 9]|uniref:hypothetical protein n=1 Tax=Bordetella genomosp. 9 TaxID=1416803 RepID=UPI001177A998|nr:hypothetical protein [Bordetella genomosp. 9]